jgi:hypothetical protein
MNRHQSIFRFRLLYRKHFENTGLETEEIHSYDTHLVEVPQALDKVIASIR